jgi:hypothetical protein
MHRSIAAFSFTLVVLAGNASAASQQRCLEVWKSIDNDANGALDASEDKAGYIAGAAKSGAKVVKANQLSREEFLQYCATNVAEADGSNNPQPAASKESGTAPKDLGKGDITPGTKPLQEADVRKKLEASGYRELSGLKLDGSGIWSAETTVNGKRVTVRVDPQGDIVSQ